MIVLGTTGITMTKDRGEFHCPQCGCSRGYRFRRVRRFFTVYFIPIIPMDVMEEFVECDHCRVHFDEAMLSAEPGSTGRELFEHIKRVMILMIVADGVAEAGEVEGVQGLYQELTGSVLPEQDLRDEISLAVSSHTQASSYVRKFAATLDAEARNLLVRYAFLAATLDGNLSPNRNEQLQQLPAALGISEGQFKAIVELAAEE